MKRLKTIAIAAIAAGATSACSQIPNPPLLFGQVQTVGIGIDGSTTTQGMDLTIGFKDRNFALVPVTVRQASGNSDIISASTGAGSDDAFSVLGQFSTDVGSATGPTANLGTFFATGEAAEILAQGFRANMGGGGGTTAPNAPIPASTDATVATTP